MSMLTLSLDDERAWYRPGAPVSGTFEWRLDADAQFLEIQLLWYTEGKGTQDIEVVATARVERPEIGGRHSFSFTLPTTGPYSFSGSLISLSWAVEAVIDENGETQRLAILVGPRSSEIRLGPIPVK